MNALLDTSILVAAFYEEDTRYPASRALLRRYKKKDVSCAVHSIAEVYATLTGMPGVLRVSPDEASLYMADLRERLTLISLDSDDYFLAAELASASGAISGGIYDALIGQCALKSRAELLYTWNTKHFTRLAGIGDKVRSPIG